MRFVSLGLSAHRPEMIPLMAEAMRRHAAIFLEEPPTPGFGPMLEGELSIEEYLLPVDVEYPAFSRALCRLMRELHAEGRRIHQVEPYYESLFWVHEFFAGGGGPDELARDSLHYHVHRAERAATGTLLAYYQATGGVSFEDTVAAVVRFARADAARFRLRDSLRAQALAPLMGGVHPAYVECGLMHVALRGLLRRRLAPGTRVRSLYLADTALKSLGENGSLFGPGDLLTLLFVFHPNLGRTKRVELLAARSLIYSKIAAKEEVEDAAGTFPHLRDELACIRAARRLSLEECRRLFARIRRRGTSEARREVMRHLAP